MSAARAAMFAGAGAVLVGALSVEARAELHRFAFRGNVGEIPAPLVRSPDWVGIVPGDPMLISLVLDAPSSVLSLADIHAARLISVSLVIGGCFETTDGVGSTIRASLEEGIAPAGAAGAHNQVDFDLVLPSGVRVFVRQPLAAGIADWIIGDTRGTVRSSSGPSSHKLADLSGTAQHAVQVSGRARADAEALASVHSPSPGGLALFVPGLAYLARRRRADKIEQTRR